MKLKTSFGDTVKHKLGGLFGSSKSNSDNNTSSPQLTEPQSTNNNHSSSNNNNNNSNTGRVLGRPAASAVTNDNHRPYKNTGLEQDTNNNSNSSSRASSPNPFLMASTGINRQTNHNSNASPFARFDGSSRPSPTPPKNMFSDI